MDELYEDWLLSICGLDRKVARRVAEKFPKIESIADATPQEISQQCGLTIEEATAIRVKATESLSVGDKWYSKKSELFLCPECGSFASSDAKKCPQCGTAFEGEEEAEKAPEEERPVEAAVGAP